MKQFFRTGLLLMLTLVLGLTSAVSAEASEEPDYFFQIPALEERLTYSDDGTAATLFAPGVTKNSGWYDVNKNWKNDTRLCWAASCSNLIAWYLDQCRATGTADVSGYEGDAERIFDQFRACWDPMEGNDPLNGMNWYFTGGFSSGGAPDGLRIPESGGYLKGLPHCGDTWYLLDIHRPGLLGDTDGRFPMLEDVIDKYNPGGALYDHRNFSETIRSQLTYGAAAVSVGQSATSGHAITLWGCDYDTQTGLVNAIYVTDSDDEDRVPGHQLKRLGIKAKDPDRQGIRIEGYYLNGSPSPITEFNSSMIFFAPGAVTKEKPAPVQPLTMVRDGDAVRLTNHGRNVQTVQLIFAERDGRRMTEAFAETVVLQPEESRRFTFPGTGGGKAFVLSENGVPLCQAVEE